MKVLVNRVIGSIIFLILQLETYFDEYIEVNEESLDGDGVRDKDVIDVNDNEEDTLEVAIFRKHILFLE